MQVRNINDILHRNSSFYKKLKFTRKAAAHVDSLTLQLNHSHKSQQDSAEKGTTCTFQTQSLQSVLEPKKSKQFSLDIYLGSIQISEEGLNVGCKLDQVNGFKIANFQKPQLRKPSKVILYQEIKPTQLQACFMNLQKPVQKPQIQFDLQQPDQHKLIQFQQTQQQPVHIPIQQPNYTIEKTQQKEIAAFQAPPNTAPNIPEEQGSRSQGFQIQCTNPSDAVQLLNNLIGCSNIKSIEDFTPKQVNFSQFINKQYFTPQSNTQLFNITPSPVHSVPSSAQTFHQPNYQDYQIPSFFPSMEVMGNIHQNPFMKFNQGRVDKSSKDKANRNRKPRVRD